MLNLCLNSFYLFEFFLGMVLFVFENVVSLFLGMIIFVFGNDFICLICF